VLHRGLVLAFALCAAPAAAQEFDVDVELVFATDGSGSIDDEELRLQREGYAKALADPRVQQVIRGGVPAGSRSPSSNGRGRIAACHRRLDRDRRAGRRRRLRHGPGDGAAAPVVGTRSATPSTCRSG